MAENACSVLTCGTEAQTVNRLIERLLFSIGGLLLLGLILSDSVFGIGDSHPVVFHNVTMLVAVVCLKLSQNIRDTDVDEGKNVCSRRGRVLTTVMCGVFIFLASLDILFGFSELYRGFDEVLVALWVITIFALFYASRNPDHQRLKPSTNQPAEKTVNFKEDC
jgi:hypothetical protein